MKISVVILILTGITSQVQVGDARSYHFELQINASNITTVNITTVKENLIGDTVELVCSSDGPLAHDEKLEWLDGRIPIRHSNLANRVLQRNVSTSVILIHNFTVENYGQYRCRCVKVNKPLFSLNEHFSRENLNNIQSFCSNQVYAINLLPVNNSLVETLEEHFVNKTARSVILKCDSGNVSVWKNGSVFKDINQYKLNITILNSQDQAKIICYNSDETLDKIYYVSIKDYPQMAFDFNRPISNNDSIVVDVERKEWPVLCIIMGTDVSSLTLFVDGIEQVSNSLDYDYLLNDEDLPRVRNCNNQSIELVTIGINKAATKRVYQSSNFSCKATSYWEADAEVHFRIIGPDDVVITAPPVQSMSSLVQSTTSLSIPSNSPDSTRIIHNTVSTVVTFSPSFTPSSSSTIPTPSTSGLAPSPSSTIPTPATSGLAPSPSSTILTPATSGLAPSPSSTIPTPATSGLAPSPSSTIPTPATSGLAPSSIILATPNRSVNNIIIYVTVGSASLLVIGIIILVVFLCRNFWSFHSSPQVDPLIQELMFKCSLEQKTDDHNEADMQSPTNNSLHSFLSKQLARCEQELKGSQWSFPYNKLELGENLGSGAFGLVKKAIAHTENSSALVVAVKMLKEDSSHDDEKDLISELKMMQHVGAHPNIVCLLGATIHQGNLHIIVEFCGKGNLLHYLRSQRKNRQTVLTSKHLIAMAYQVSLGMEYLASKKYIHRDLAARNVLITDDMILKVADFGLARKVYDSIYRPSGGRIPIKWMSPETILDREYTTQSDVWSFGILLWEIVTLGWTPYPGKSADDVIKSIRKGYRMPPPDNCPGQIYSLMLKCWEQVPLMRPNFSEICRITQDLKNEFEIIGSRNLHNFEDLEVGFSGNGFIPDHIQSEMCCYCTGDVSTGQYCQCSTTLYGSQISDKNSDECSCETSKIREYTNTETCHEAGKKIKSRKATLRKHSLGYLNDSFRYDFDDNYVQPNGRLSKSMISGVEGAYYNQQSSSISYLPILSNSCFPTAKAHQSLPHINSYEPAHTCSLCKSSDQNNSSQHFSQSKASSLESICDNCKDSSLTDSSLNQQHHDSVRPKDLPLHPLSHRANDQNWPVGKMKVEQQPSNDSGVVTMTTEEAIFLDFNLSESKGQTELAMNKEEPCLLSFDTTATRHQARQFSAHPRHRALFEKFGIVESDV